MLIAVSVFFGRQTLRNKESETILTSAEVISGSSGTNIVRGKELRDSEASPSNQRRWPRLFHPFPAVHHCYQPERHKNRQATVTDAPAIAPMSNGSIPVT